ncbi:Protein CHLOROPLAST IMPORT APPARATUS 2 [Linum perenne]
MSSSPCLTRGGGGRAYGLLEVEVGVKSTTSFSTITTSSSSSPSSTLSESSPLAISTKKPRTSTRRKRPNQTYNEAAALLSTAYPKIFSLPAAALPKQQPLHSLPLDSSDLLLPLRALDSSCRFLPIREKQVEEQDDDDAEEEEPIFSVAAEVSSRWQNSGYEKAEQEEEDFDAESMLDEEIEQVGIDSIMGVMMNNEDLVMNHNVLNHHHYQQQQQQTSFVYGYPPGFHNQWIGNCAGGGGNINNRAFRRSVDDWWNYPVVDVLQISPRLHSTNQLINDGEEKAKQSSDAGEKINKNGNKQKKKLKMKKVAKLGGEMKEEAAEEMKEELERKEGGGMLLKLNYDEVLKEWSGKGSPFPEEAVGGFLEEGCDASAIAAQIDLFSSDGSGGGGGGGMREASVLRYKEKRLSRLFSKKIRYQVRKVNADQRPRMKGRFVRRSSSSRNSRSRNNNNQNEDDEL